jgi:hypothetical protein
VTGDDAPAAEPDADPADEAEEPADDDEPHPASRTTPTVTREATRRLLPGRELRIPASSSRRLNDSETVRALSHFKVTIL